MSRFEQLLGAATPVDFFITFFHFVSRRDALRIDLDIVPAYYEGRKAIKLTVPQNVVYLRPNGERLVRKEITHVLILAQDGKIVWEIKDQEPVVGLDDIKAKLLEWQNADTDDLSLLLPTSIK
ncbi:MAG: hypothetical protein JXB30_04710 [Anaerolineae bacterium]|nr:hypothetical protein [Anaerolineae bacterium]